MIFLFYFCLQNTNYSVSLYVCIPLAFLPFTQKIFRQPILENSWLYLKFAIAERVKRFFFFLLIIMLPSSFLLCLVVFELEFAAYGLFYIYCSILYCLFSKTPTSTWSSSRRWACFGSPELRISSSYSSLDATTQL